MHREHLFENLVSYERCKTRKERRMVTYYETREIKNHIG